MSHHRINTSRRARAQGGFTILEMMVALAIGLVVALGFTASFIGMKTSFNSQSSLTQLQDNERIAMAVLTSAVTQAGYFPTGANPATSVAGKMTRADLYAGADTVGGSMAAMQYLYGTTAGTPTSTTKETLSTAFVSAPGDGQLSCQGSSVASSTTTNVTLRNTFYVDTTSNTLGCTVQATAAATSTPTVTPTNTTFTPLVTNVKSMSVLYGIDYDADGNVDTYMPASLVTTAQWSSVKSVRVTLNFINPNDSSAVISWIQTINVMNNK